MLVGYNTNISYKDKIYHIQTEDSGQNNPVVVTLLYSKGAILASKKTNYAHIINDPNFKEKVRKLMQAQHKSMIKELLSGKYTGEYKDEGEVEARGKAGEEVQAAGEVKDKVEQTEQSEPIQIEKMETKDENMEQPEEKTETKGQITKSLDDILLNYIIKRSK